jgi:hypothetical protein
MNRWFGSEPIGPEEWMAILAVAATIYVAVGLEKWIGRRFLMT